MKKTILMFVLLSAVSYSSGVTRTGSSSIEAGASNYKPMLAFDELRCIIQYEFFEKAGENRKTVKLFKDGANYKLTLKEHEGQPNEMTTTSYIYLDSSAVYTISETGSVKMGTRKTLETMYVGMAWGIYFLNFPKSNDFISTATRNGTGTILSKECLIYDVMVTEGGTRYWFWNDIMLRKILTVEGTTVVTLQATNINESPVFAPGEFDLPSGVQYF